MASASQDLKVLRVMLETKEYDDANQLRIPHVLHKGNQVYLAMLQPTHRVQFQFNSFRKVAHKELSKTMRELIGDPTPAMSANTRSLQDLWGCDVASLKDKLSEEQFQAPANSTEPVHFVGVSWSREVLPIGAILTLWLRWVDTAFDRPDDPPIAVVATSRAQHREDLRRNITKFLPGD